MQDRNEDYLYLLDANAIRQLDFEYLNKVREIRRLVTIDDVKYEVDSLAKTDLIPCVSLGVNAFSKMSELIASGASVQRLISYFENKGAADVSILAYVLTANDGKLITDEFVVVTEDSALRQACDEFTVKWCSVDNFRAPL